jgi:hypothetical protein
MCILILVHTKSSIAWECALARLPADEGGHAKLQGSEAALGYFGPS